MSEAYQIARFYEGNADQFCGLWSTELKRWVSDYVDATTFDEKEDADLLAHDLQDAYAMRGQPYNCAAIPLGK